MRRLATVLLLVLPLIGAGPAALAAPGNDNFADATEIASIPYTDTVDTTDATEELLEPACVTYVGGPARHTIWYRYTPTSDATLSADTSGSEFDSILAVYVGTNFLDLQTVGCADSTWEGRESVLFHPAPGETYYFQIEGYYGDAGLATFHLGPSGGIAGTVSDASGPASNICVDAHRADDPWSYWGWAMTDGSGSYSVTDLAPGDYKVMFSECGSGSHAAEWYNDKADFDQADVIDVQGGATTSGIDAFLEGAPLPPEADLAVTRLSVENLPIQTDFGTLGYTGWMRDVTVEVSNLAGGPAPASLTVEVCPRTEGLCSVIAREYFESIAQEAPIARSYQWNAAGLAGDVRVQARVDSCSVRDPDYDNNWRSVDHYVIAGGLGVGVGVSAFTDPSPGYYPCDYLMTPVGGSGPA